MTKPPRKPSKPLLGAAEAPLRSRPRRRRDPAEPQLLLDPMPARIDPCLALLKPRPPKGRQWAFEVKWDGYRLAVHIEPKGIRILSSGGHDWTDRFPAIAAAARRLPLSTRHWMARASCSMSWAGRFRQASAVTRRPRRKADMKASSLKTGTARIAAGAAANGRRSNASRATTSPLLAITGPARRPGISALLVAVQREGQLVYVGSVGTGFKAS